MTQKNKSFGTARVPCIAVKRLSKDNLGFPGGGSKPGLGSNQGKSQAVGFVKTNPLRTLIPVDSMESQQRIYGYRYLSIYPNIFSKGFWALESL